MNSRSMHSITTLLYVASLLTVLPQATSSHAPTRRKTLRGLQSEHVLKCKVLLMDTSFQFPAKGEEHYVCMPISNEDDRQSDMDFTLNLPEPFLQEHAAALRKSNRIIQITGGATLDHDDYTVSIPEDADIELLRESRLVPIVPEYQTKKMLILRVSTTDSEPTLSASQMREKNFGDRDLTLRSQYRACSFGKLTFDPASGIELADGDLIQDGVLDVALDVTAAGSSRQKLTNNAKKKVKEMLGIDEDGEIADMEGIDNVMICHPPGSNANPNGQDWLAYSFLDYHISVYNDLRCGYISATMHEVAHNVGFRHSNEEGEYKDKTGYMGFSYKANDWPAMCFNAHKNYVSNWFNDRILTINPAEDGIWQGVVATFVDYPLTQDGEVVVLRVGDIYVQYNRAKGMNAQTQEYPDMLTIVQDAQGEGSELLGALDGRDWNTTLYFQENFGDNNETLYIVVCGTHLGDGGVTTPDYMWVSVGLGLYDCAANQERGQTAVPPPSPSAPPNGPTPTGPPSWIAPDRGDECDDEKDGLFWVGESVGLQNCQWLKQNPEMKEFMCINGEDAYDVCAETCHKCTDSCANNPWFFFDYEGNAFATCSWLAGERQNVIDDVCVWGSPAFENCRETCSSCPSSIDDHALCDDSPVRAFYVPELDTNKRCFWLKNNVEYQESLCVIDSPAFHLCPETCQKCFDYCKDDPTASFQFEGNTRDCSWLATKYLKWNDACIIPDIFDACRESCENCD